jgi:hypothetical protein
MKTDYCSAAPCKRIDAAMTGFTPGRTYTVEFWTTHGGSGMYRTWQITMDGNGDFNGAPGNRAFGYPREQLWLKVDGVESNHVTWW